MLNKIMFKRTIAPLKIEQNEACDDFGPDIIKGGKPAGFSPFFRYTVNTQLVNFLMFFLHINGVLFEL